MSYRPPLAFARGFVPWLCLGLFACNGGPAGVADAGIEPEMGMDVLVALAGSDLVALEGSRVQLSGGASRVLDGAADLNWTQVDGPPVLLTNPSGPNPTFVAPLSPDTLVFRLRVQSGDSEAIDEVRVDIVDQPPPPPTFIELGPDIVRPAGETATFTVRTTDAPDLTAQVLCTDGTHPVDLEGQEVRFETPDALPCLLIVDGTEENRPNPGRAAAAVWPPGVPLPTETRVTGPIFADPGETYSLTPVVPLAVTETMTLAAAGGLPLDLTDVGSATELITPRREGRIFMVAERRLGSASGGMHIISLDVSAGPRNVAPTVSAGPDRLIPPGATFGLSAEYDDVDQDPEVELLLSQVFGPQAPPDPLNPLIFTAPDEPAILLFHVEADDGLVKSQIDTVRVTVSEDVANVPPVLNLPPEIYVTPGASFTIDAGGAVDPDSGIIDRVVIAQAAEDPVVLLENPVEMTSLTLTAGLAGDIYRFQVSAFDEQGASTSASLDVIVETAGPHVDPDRGDDILGDGTAAAPFASVGGALPVAARHRFDALLLTVGQHAPFSGVLPPGTGLDGGYTFVDGAYEKSPGEASGLTITAAGLESDSGAFTDLAIVLDAESAPVLLRGTVTMTNTTLTETSVHTGPALLVDEDAALDMRASTMVGSASATGAGPLVSALAGATLSFTDSEIRGSGGTDRQGLSIDGAFVRLLRTVVRGSQGATNVTGVYASAGQLEVLESTVEGGLASGRAVGIASTDTLVFMDPQSTVVGLTQGTCAEAWGVTGQGTLAPLVLSGTIAATAVGADADLATGVDVTGTNTEIRAASVEAHGLAEARGLVILDAAAFLLEDVQIDASGSLATAVEAGGFETFDADTGAWMVNGDDAEAMTVEGDEGAVVLRDITVDVTGTSAAHGVRVPGAGTTQLDDLSIVVSSGGPATGLSLHNGTVRDGRVVVTGTDSPIGVDVVTSGETVVIERTRALVDGANATGFVLGADVLLLSSFSRSTGLEAVGVAVWGSATALHLSVRAEGSAVSIAPAGTLEIANSHVEGAVGLEGRSDANVTTFAAVTALAPVAVRDADGTETTDTGGLLALGCGGCAVLAGPTPIDDEGHLSADAAPLIDQGTPALTVSYDIDGEPRPNGILPDIGCDEESPPET